MDPIQLSPFDEHNRVLAGNVHPPEWRNPTPAPRYNLVVIGGGTAGLVTAAGAAGLGAKVALVERHLLGGDCLNYGCVPSKALIRSARAMADVREASRFGVTGADRCDVDFGAVMIRLREVRAGISKHDSAQRFQSLGIDVFLGNGQFTARDRIEVDGTQLRFAKAVIATGARASAPQIPGLAEAGFLTNETVFNLVERPARLAVIGGGPIGCELAQAFRRLGCDVTLFHKNAHLLDREDRDAAEIVRCQFARERIRIVASSVIERVERSETGKCLSFTAGGTRDVVIVDEILVATGRAPNVDGLGLDAAAVEHDQRDGVKVDDYLRTTNPRIYAAGDVCMRWKFTHAADASARIVIQNALFLGRKRVSSLVVPWCTYTDPEVAHVGLSEAEASDRQIEADVFVREFKDVDRARTDGHEEGFVKVLVRKRTDRILGATIVGRHAGEMIGELTLAMTAGIGLSRIASVIHPYPTHSEAIKHVADAYNRTRLTPTLKRFLSRWFSWRR